MCDYIKILILQKRRGEELLKLSENKTYYRVLKILAITLFTIAFFRYFFSDSFIWVIKDGYYGGVYYNESDIWQTFLRWGQYTSYVVLPMAVFYKSKLFKNIAIFFCLPFSVLNVIFFSEFMKYFVSDPNGWFVLNQNARAIYFIFELVISISIPLMFIAEKDFKYIKSNIKKKEFWLDVWKQARIVLLLLPIILLALMPVYVPQSLFGYTRIDMGAFTLANILWIVLTIAELWILYLIFRFKDRRARQMLVMFLALQLFMHYNAVFLMGFNIGRLPIQLCNMGAYFFVIALLLKKQKFFNFVFLANVMGTLLAMLMPDVNGGIASFWNIHFLIEHMQVLVVPMLCMMLRIFERPGKRAYLHLVIGFSCYFLFCLIAGTIINGFEQELGQGRVNFFYIFDVARAADEIPLIAFMQNNHLVIGRFEFYPLFQVFMYFGFLILCLVLLGGIRKFCEILDDHMELREHKIQMQEKRTGKKSKAPRVLPE